MAASDTEIANLALSHLGSGKNISNLDEQSQEARAAKQFLSISRDTTLRDFAWPFATKRVCLSLVEETPNTEWGFSYRYPSDAIKLVRIVSGIRNENHQIRIPYKIESDDDGLIMFTDQRDAEIQYTFRQDDVVRFPVDFAIAMSFRLAAYMVPRISKGDVFKIRKELLQT